MMMQLASMSSAGRGAACLAEPPDRAQVAADGAGPFDRNSCRHDNSGSFHTLFLGLIRPYASLRIVGLNDGDGQWSVAIHCAGRFLVQFLILTRRARSVSCFPRTDAHEPFNAGPEDWKRLPSL